MATGTRKNPLPYSLGALDGLRGLASLAVMTSHAIYAAWIWGQPEEFGAFGVWIFFSLSGFLMAYHYLPGECSMRYWLAFLTRRFFRVYPLFFTVLLALLALSRVDITFTDFTQIDWTIVINHWLLQDGIGIFWTIPVEIEFYGLFPLLVLPVLLLRIPDRYYPAVWTGFWVISIAIVSAGTFNHYPKHTLLPHLPFFLGGAAAGSIQRQINIPVGYKRHVWNLLAIASFTALLVLIYNPPVDMRRASPDIESQHIWFKSGIMAFTVLSLAQATGIVRWLFGNPVMAFLGKISYSLYLLHHFVLYSTNSLKPIMPLGAVGIYLLAIAIAFVSYKLIEDHFMALARI